MADSRLVRDPAFSVPRAAYIHVPFCAHRCGYCDFTLVAGRDELIDAYLDALEIELGDLGEPCEVDTLFFGGGTPSHLSPTQLERLLRMVLHWFPPADGHEFTVEANPADMNADRIDVLAAGGVNRISLGVQSFDANLLEILERDHRSDDIVATVDRLRRRFENLSFDLMFGVPGQSVETWRQTVRQAIALEPTHISTYGLTYEKGTAFWSRRRKGDLAPVCEELERSMYDFVMEALPTAGFEQYELSNFARPGYRCRHNDVYWTGRSSYGFGPGAARYVGGRRETNHRSVTTWLKRIRAGQSPVGDAEVLSPECRAREAIVLGLRRADGIDIDEFRLQTGFDMHRLAGDAIARHLRGGLLEEQGPRLRLTREGRFLADTVIVDFL